MSDAFEATVAGGGRAPAVRIEVEGDLDGALRWLGVPRGPVVLLFGGAARLDEALRPRIERFLVRAFLPAVADLGGIVLDGGTDAGVMGLVGLARERLGGGPRIVGVAPFAKVRVPGSPGSTELAPGHAGFVLVPGAEWGSEKRWFSAIADRISSGPSTSVLIGGGPLAIEEVERSLELGRRVVIVDGTGRAADDAAAAVREPSEGDPPLSAIAANPSVVVVDVGVGPHDLEEALLTIAPTPRLRS